MVDLSSSQPISTDSSLESTGTTFVKEEEVNCKFTSDIELLQEIMMRWLICHHLNPQVHILAQNQRDSGITPVKEKEVDCKFVSDIELLQEITKYYTRKGAYPHVPYANPKHMKNFSRPQIEQEIWNKTGWEKRFKQIKD